jgi:hypothetical protein
MRLEQQRSLLKFCLTKNFGVSEKYQNFQYCGSKTVYFGSELGKVPDLNPDINNI